ncbi:hypothetical protein Tco_0266294 [Tanacetum coccineum]
MINDMNIYNMKIEQFQVNTKFLNSLPSEWSKFVTNVKLVKDLHTTNFDQPSMQYLEQQRTSMPMKNPGGVPDVKFVQIIISKQLLLSNKDALKLMNSDCDEYLESQAVSFGQHRLTMVYDGHIREMEAEQAFWLRISNPTSKPSDASSVKIEAPKELPNGVAW